MDSNNINNNLLVPHILRHPSESLFLRVGRYASTLWYRCVCKYNDMCIALKCGRFPCHKLVVGCHSRFFEDIFVNKKHTEVILVDLDLPQFSYITKPAMEIVLRWMYYGEYTPCSDDTDARILSNLVADFQIDGLVAHVGRRRSLREKAALGEPPSIKDLHFKDLVGTQAFLELDDDSLIALLSDDNLAIMTEMDIFNSVWIWILKDRGHRLRHLKRLMACVRFPLMTTKELLICGAVLIDYPECHDFLIISGWYHTSMRYRDQFKMFFIVPKSRSGFGLSGGFIPAPSYSLTGLFDALPKGIRKSAKGSVSICEIPFGGEMTPDSIEDSIFNKSKPLDLGGIIDDLIIVDDGRSILICPSCENAISDNHSKHPFYKNICENCNWESFTFNRELGAHLIPKVKSIATRELENQKRRRPEASTDDLVHDICAFLENMMAYFNIQIREKGKNRLGQEDLTNFMASISIGGGGNRGGGGIDRDIISPYSGSGDYDVLRLIEEVIPKLEDCIEILKRGCHASDHRTRPRGGKKYWDGASPESRSDIRYQAAPQQRPYKSNRQSQHQDNVSPTTALMMKYNQGLPPGKKLPSTGDFMKSGKIYPSSKHPQPIINPASPESFTSTDMKVAKKGSSTRGSGFTVDGSEPKKVVKKKKRQKSSAASDSYEYDEDPNTKVGGGPGKDGTNKKSTKQSGKEKEKEKEKARKKDKAKSQKRGGLGKSKRSKGEKSLATKSVRSKRGKTKLMIDGQSIHPPPQRGAIPMPGLGGRSRAPDAIRARSKVPSTSDTNATSNDPVKGPEI